MGKHTGDEVGRDRQPLLRPLIIIVTTFAAWVALVWFAIRLGPAVKAGDTLPILLLVVACLGAMACLFLTMLQVSLVVTLMRRETAAPHVPGRRVRR